jgi:hypothetical protein
MCNIHPNQNIKQSGNLSNGQMEFTRKQSSTKCLQGFALVWGATKEGLCLQWGEDKHITLNHSYKISLLCDTVIGPKNTTLKW